MVNQQLLAYINQELRKGRSREDIKKTLSEMGWLDIYLEDAFSMVLNPVQHDLISDAQKPDIASEAKAMAKTQSEMNKPAQTARQEVRDVFSQTPPAKAAPDMPPVSRPQGIGTKPTNGNVKVEVKKSESLNVAAKATAPTATHAPQTIAPTARINPMAAPIAKSQSSSAPRQFNWDKVLLATIIVLPIIIIGLVIFWVLKR